MFMGRLVSDPDDILIYGYGTALKHRPDRDDASAEDIALRSWKSEFPHYLRVHHVEFIAGTLNNGISLYELMRTMGSNSFRSTKENVAAGTGNFDLRAAYRRHAAVELTPEAVAWLRRKHAERAAVYGTLPAGTLDQLDRPIPRNVST